MYKFYLRARLCALFWFILFCASSCQASEPTLSLSTPTRQPNQTVTPTVATPLSITTEAAATATPSLVANTPTVTPVATATTAENPTSTATLTPETIPVESAPAPAPVGTVVYYEESVTLPTYPLERYQSDAIDPTYNWPYKKFDIERFHTEAPTPTARTYRLLVLENAYLKVLILPELGGRIWQVIHKPTNKPMFYQNKVVKPTHWGIAQQLGWMAVGGIEWSVPVQEHGYDWGTKWGFIPLQYSEDLAAVTVFTPRDDRLLNVSITISLHAGAASFEIEPTLTNLSTQELAFSFWQDAMLAPGSGKKPSAQLHFLIPGKEVTLHSTGNMTMPMAGQPFSWPFFQGRDLSRLGNWEQYLGFFERPAAHGPFTGVYDPAYDAGAVHIFPNEVVRGSKVFALGWQQPLGSDNFTDDDSSYVELHTGLAPTFDDRYRLPAGGQVSWRETWYPVVGIGDLTYANEVAALHVEPKGNNLTVGLYTTRPVDGALVLQDETQELARLAVQVQPDAPFAAVMRPASLPKRYTLELQDSAGFILLKYQP